MPRIPQAAVGLAALLTLGTSLAHAADSPWARVVVIGASVSAGFTESEPLGGPQTPNLRLSRYVNAAIAVPHEPVRSFATTLFFLQPEAEARHEIAETLKTKPTLVLGIDFLFWFCYGQAHDEAARLRRFDEGLKLLEPLECPVVLGDIPDASGSLNRMLSREQIPTPASLAAANRRLKQWAAGRTNAVILPLASFMQKVLANQAVEVHGRLLPEGKTRTLLQADRLHPTPRGAAFLAVALLDSFQATLPKDTDREIHWDIDQVLRSGLP